MSSLKLKDDSLKPFEMLLDQTSIEKKIVELGKKITVDYKNKNPLLIGVLKGCVVFMADLIRNINLPLELDFVTASSYKKGKTPEKEIDIVSEIKTDIKNRHILLVEGVVDSGRTASNLIKQLEKMEPASIEIVTLIDKPASHRVKIEVKYKGFSIGNEFVIGFGLDNTQKYRNLPFIGKMIDN